ncbi:MAG: hypothetical protein WBP02_16900 [Gammaproteobacteria bacterium]
MRSKPALVRKASPSLLLTVGCAVRAGTSQQPEDPWCAWRTLRTVIGSMLAVSAEAGIDRLKSLDPGQKHAGMTKKWKHAGMTRK